MARKTKDVDAETVDNFKKELERLVAEAKKAGYRIQPSTAATVVLEPDPAFGPTKLKKLKPGAKRGAARFEWELEDFGPKKTWIEFIPQEIEEMRNFIRQIEYNDGTTHRWLRMTVNGCSIWLQLNRPNTVPAAFYHAYQNQLQGSIELKKLVRTGSTTDDPYAPWSKGGFDGKNTWFHDVAHSPWYDSDGRMVSSRHDYIMLDGIPYELDRAPVDFQFIRGGQVQDISGKRIDFKAPTRQEHMERIGKEKPTKIAVIDGKPQIVEETYGHKEESQRGIEHGSSVPVPSGSDEQPNPRNRRGNSKPRKVSKGSVKSSSGNAA